MIIASGPFKGWNLTWDDRGEYNPCTLAPPPGSTLPLIAEDLEAVLQRVFGTPDLTPPRGDAPTTFKTNTHYPAPDWISPTDRLPADGEAVIWLMKSDGTVLQGWYNAPDAAYKPRHSFITQKGAWSIPPDEVGGWISGAVHTAHPTEWVSPVKATPEDGQAVLFLCGSHDGPVLQTGLFEAARGLFHFGPVSGGYFYHLRSVIGWQPAPALPAPDAFPWGFMFPNPDYTGKALWVTEAEAMAVQDAFQHGTAVQLRGRWVRCLSWGWAVGQAPGVPQYIHARLRYTEGPEEAA